MIRSDDERSCVKLLPGDPAPWFRQASTSNPNYAFDTAAGRYIVLCFFGSGSDEDGAAAIAAIETHRHLFDDEKIALFGVSVDPGDNEGNRVRQMLPGIRHFWDFDGRISRLYGALPRKSGAGDDLPFRRLWMVLNPSLRVRAVFPFDAAAGGHDAVFAYLEALPPVGQYAGIEIPAPVIVLPDVFEPDLCRLLISLHEKHGGTESGFMRDVGGKTVLVNDHGHKQRRDYTIEDEALRRIIQQRLLARVNPEIEKVHFFKPTRMERYIVSCYAAEEGGHFRPHRDNTTLGTAHRRFAVSINLNDDFDGGEISFPEYGPRSYKAPPGGAIVFTCPLLHAVSKVTRGRRYAFLPFLYDNAAARLREANSQHLDGQGGYRAETR